MTSKLTDNLYEEIFALITDWIMTNDIDFNHYHCREYGYLKQYAQDDEKLSKNYFAMMFTLRWALGRYNLEAFYERYQKEQGTSSVMTLAILEDEKLMAIHEKMLLWAERHRQRPEFNKVEKGRGKCYRPTQYYYAIRWLWKDYRKPLLDWKKEHIKYIHKPIPISF